MNTQTLNTLFWSNGTVTASSLSIDKKQPVPPPDLTVATITPLEPAAPPQPVLPTSVYFAEVYRNYIPPHAAITETPHGIVYSYERVGKLLAVAYRGKSKQAAWHYSFSKEQHRQANIQEFFRNLEAAAQRKADQQAERRQVQAHTIPLGTIIENSWGYDQTNVDFFEVVRVSAHYVWLQPLKQTKTETGYMSGHTSSVPGSAHGEITKHGVLTYSENSIVNFKHGSGSLWDGKPLRYSSYA